MQTLHMWEGTLENEIALKKKVPSRWRVNKLNCNLWPVFVMAASQTTRFMGPTWSPPGPCGPQVGPMLAPWTLLSGMLYTMSSYIVQCYKETQLWSLCKCHTQITKAIMLHVNISPLISNKWTLHDLSLRPASFMADQRADLSTKHATAAGIWHLWATEYYDNSHQISDKGDMGQVTNCGCIVTWFCYQMIAKPGNKTAIVPWPDPYTPVTESIHGFYEILFNPRSLVSESILKTSYTRMCANGASECPHWILLYGVLKMICHPWFWHRLGAYLVLSHHPQQWLLVTWIHHQNKVSYSSKC